METSQPARAFQKGDVQPMPKEARTFKKGTLLKHNGYSYSYALVDDARWDGSAFPPETQVVTEYGTSSYPVRAGDWIGGFVLASPAPEETWFRVGDRVRHEAHGPALGTLVRKGLCEGGWYVRFDDMSVESHNMESFMTRVSRTPEPAAEGKAELARKRAADLVCVRCDKPAVEAHRWQSDCHTASAGYCSPECRAVEHPAQSSPVKADKPYLDPYKVHMAFELGQLVNDPKNTASRNEAARLRNLAALRRDLDSSSAKRRAALGRRFDGRVGIDLEQAWSTPGDES